MSDKEIPTSFCPLINGKCKRLLCALWIATKSYHGCSFFFMGVKAATEIETESNSINSIIKERHNDE